MLNVIDLVLSLLSSLLTTVKGSAAADASEIAQGIEAAIASLQAVQGSPVTYAQLESLRTKPTF